MVFGKGKQKDMKEISRVGGKAMQKKHPQEGDKNHNWKGGRSKDNYYYKKRQVAKFPEKISARERVHKAIISGRLIKPDNCEICGKYYEDKTKIHGHHKDYNQPLKVVWCCKKCHSGLHG